MKKTAKPMTGGMIWPPLEAAASIAAASSPRMPTRFMSGIVMLPDIYTLPMVLPETVPTRALDMTAMSGGPVRPAPKSARDSPDDEIHRADLLQHLSQNQEQRHVFETCADGEAHDSGIVQIEERDNPLEAEPPVPAEPDRKKLPEEEVQKKRACNDGEAQTQAAPDGDQDQVDAGNADNDVRLVRQALPIRQFPGIQNDISEYGDSERQVHAVKDLSPAAAVRCRKEKRGNRKKGDYGALGQRNVRLPIVVERIERNGQEQPVLNPPSRRSCTLPGFHGSVPGPAVSSCRPVSRDPPPSSTGSRRDGMGTDRRRT